MFQSVFGRNRYNTYKRGTFKTCIWYGFLIELAMGFFGDPESRGRKPEIFTPKNLKFEIEKSRAFHGENFTVLKVELTKIVSENFSKRDATTALQ